MKIAKTLTAALVFSGAALMAQSASAADISKPVETIDLNGGTGSFDRLITGNNRGNTFADSYAFTLTGTSKIFADTYSRSGNPRNGLDILGFGLYNAGGLVQQGTRLSAGATDQWQLDLDSLAAGSYFLRVSGSVLSNAAGRYSSSLTVTPEAVTVVPEPDTYGMMLGGLAVMGAVLGRRQRKHGVAV